ncbi:MAG TPA: NADH-quinone oxidoreductase subunit L [Opitutaceae bacterium]|jgi:NADH-quinone oxidoreductase subunit L|nr:NADH-quinone oxidoreductase subunit L [Opitutaceae bacterium]
MSPAHLAALTLGLPLASATLIACFLRRRGSAAAFISVLAAVGIAAIAFDLGLRGVRFGAAHAWFAVPGLRIDFGFHYDDLAALMLCIVGLVGLCVHVFSLGYMHDDPAKGRYFGGLSIFMFSMIGIVLADNLFMIFIFWELVGFSSWLLINHWHERPGPVEASKKAFIVNRVGDFGFLLGILYCYWAHGTVSLTALAAQAHAGSVLGRAIPLLLFCGAVGKSAQLPLQVWLPDAMEGPTPVSALIHAATMVAAGIYMLCRIDMLMVPDALRVIRWVGTLTALYAALCAITQSDIKRVLAYSTLSQLGYMVAAFGLGPLQVGGAGRWLVLAGVGAAMFHLTTHAFFKALLFLGSGSVIHGCHDQDIFKMGGLRRRMPITFVTFTIAVAAISGLPFLAGFFSKDAILYLAYANDRAVFWILAFTAALTAFYMCRMWKLTFLGRPRTEAAEHAHESGAVMTLPLIVLAILSVLGGYKALYARPFAGILDRVPEAPGGISYPILVTSLIVLTVGAAAALLFYRSDSEDTLSLTLPGVFGGLSALRESFDAVYDYYVAKVQQRVAMVLNFIDVIGLAGAVVRGVAGLAGLAGLGLRALHVGRINAYVTWFLIGVVIFWAFATGLL